MPENRAHPDTRKEAFAAGRVAPRPTWAASTDGTLRLVGSAPDDGLHARGVRDPGHRRRLAGAALVTAG